MPAYDDAADRLREILNNATLGRAGVPGHGEGIDPHELLMRVARRTRQAASGVIEVLGSDRFRVNPLKGTGGQSVFSTLSEAMLEARTSSFQTFDELQGGVLTSARGRYGGQYYGFLEELSRRLTASYGSSARLMRISVGTDEAGLRYVERQMARGGIAIPDDDNTVVLRLMKSGTQDMSFDEITEFMNRQFGMTIDDVGKVFKRMKQMTNVRQMQQFRDQSYKVGVFSPERMMAELGDLTIDSIADDSMARIATEGMSVINPEVARGIRDSLTQRANDLRAMDNWRDHMGEIRGIEHSIKEINRAMRQGGRFNMRMLGVDVAEVGSGINDSIVTKWFNNQVADGRADLFGLSNIELKHIMLEEMKGQIKGDVMIGRGADFRKGGKFFGYDLITSVHNVKKELQMSKGAFITLDGHPYADEVFTDAQTLAQLGRTGAFSVDDLMRSTQGYFEESAEAIVERGEIPQGFLKYLQDLAAGGLPLPDDPARAQAMLNQQAFAQYMTQRYEAGIPVNQDPGDARMLLNSLRAFLDDKSGRPHLLIPDARRGKITTAFTTSQMGAQVDVQPVVGRGMIAWDTATQSWVMNDIDAGIVFRALGGYDLDDTLVSMLRYDDASNTLRVLGFRQPNAMGEHVTFGIDAADDYVLQMLSKKGQSNAVAIEELNQQIKDLRRAQVAEVGRLRDQASTYRRSEIASDNIPGNRAYILEQYKNQIRDTRDEYESLIRSVQDDIKVHKETIRLSTRELVEGGYFERLNFKTAGLDNRSFQMVDKLLTEEIMRRREAGMLTGTNVSREVAAEILNDVIGGYSKGVKGLHPAFEMLEPIIDEGGEGAGRLTAETIVSRMKTLVSTAGELGKYSNARMIADALVSENPAYFMHHPGTFKVTTQESVIDMLISGMRATIGGAPSDEAVQKLTTEMLEQAGYHGARIFAETGGTRGLDMALARRRAGSVEARAAVLRGIRRFEAEAPESAKSLTRVFDPRRGIGPFGDMQNSYFDEFFANQKYLQEYMADYVKAETQAMHYPASIMKRGLAEDEVTEAARRFLDKYLGLRSQTEAIAKQRVTLQGFELAEDVIAEEIGRESKRILHAEMLAEVRSWLEPGEEIGPKVYERLAEAMRLSVSEAGYRTRATANVFSMVTGEDVSIGLLKNATVLWAERTAEGITKSESIITTGIDDVVDSLGRMRRTVHATGDILDETLTARDLDEVISHIGGLDAREAEALAGGGFGGDGGGRVPPGGDDFFDDFGDEFGGFGDDRAARASADYDTSGRVINRFKRINLGDIRGLFSDPLVRKGSFVAAGAVAFSFLYQATKDRSPEDFAGPPLLPGGSYYASPEMGPQDPALYQYSGPQDGGITWKVFATNVRDFPTFRQQLGAISNAPTSGTIYQAPSFNDIFSDIEGTF